jgi:hypothetical protein
VVAGLAGGDHVLPAVPTAPVPWQNVVQRQLAGLLTAVLAGEAVPKEDVAPCEPALWPGAPDQVDQAYYGRDLEDGCGAVEVTAAVLNGLRLAAVKQDYRPAYIAYVEGFIVLIQYEYR